MNKTALLKAKDQREVMTKNTKLGRCPHCNAIMTLHKVTGTLESSCICCGKHFLWDK